MKRFWIEWSFPNEIKGFIPLGIIREVEEFCKPGGRGWLIALESINTDGSRENASVQVKQALEQIGHEHGAFTINVMNLDDIKDSLGRELDGYIKRLIDKRIGEEIDGRNYVPKDYKTRGA